MSCPLRPRGLQPARLLYPWNFPGKNTGVGYPFLLQGIFHTQQSNLSLLHWQVDFLPLTTREALGLTACVCAQSCLTICDLVAATHQAPLSMEFSRQEHWNGLPFPSPRDLPDPGLNPRPLRVADSLPLATWEARPPGLLLIFLSYPAPCLFILLKRFSQLYLSTSQSSLFLILVTTCSF